MTMYKSKEKRHRKQKQEKSYEINELFINKGEKLGKSFAFTFHIEGL